MHHFFYQKQKNEEKEIRGAATYRTEHNFSAIGNCRSMKRGGYMHNMYTIPLALKACSASMDLRVGSQVHASVVKSGLDFNIYTGNGLIYMYGKCRCLEEARQVLDEMPCKDVVSWNSMVAGYAQNHRFDDALRVCKEMESFRVKPDAGTMVWCVKERTAGKEVLCLETRTSREMKTIIYQTKQQMVNEYVAMKSCFDASKTVAEGYLQSLDPTCVVGGQVLGKSSCSILIQVAVVPSEELFRPFDMFETIGDIIGLAIAWPKHLVFTMDED